MAIIWKQKLSIDNTKIDGDLTDFTKLTLDTSPIDSTFWNYVDDGGGNIRASTSNDLTGRFAVDIRMCDTAAQTLDMAGLHPTVSSSTDEEWWLILVDSGETQPAANDTYGQYNAYDSSYVGVWPLNEDPSGTAPQMLDRTSNGNDGTSNGSMTSGDSVAGKAGNAMDFDGVDDYVDAGSSNSFAITETVTLSAWLYLADDSAKYRMPLSKNGAYYIGIDNTSNHYFRGSIFDGNDQYGKDTTTSVPYTQWTHVVMSYDGTSLEYYVNGIDIDSSAHVGSIDEQPNRIVTIGDYTSNSKFRWDGLLDEIRISNTARSAAWLKAEYENLINAATFETAGTPSVGNRRRRLLLAGAY